MDGVQLPQGHSLFEEAVYFLPLSSQKFLVLILLTLEGWKAESTLEPPSGFEHGTLDWESSALTTSTLLHNPRTSHDIDMKLGPVTKLEKKNTTMSKQFDDDTISASCDVIVCFLIYGQFAAIWKLDSRRMVYKTYAPINISSIVTFYLTETQNRTKKSQTLLLYYCFE